MKEDNNIDKIFRDHLKIIAPEPERNVWEDMRWSLFWFRNKTYIITSAIAAFLVIAGIWYYQNTSPFETSQVISLDNNEYTSNMPVVEKPTEPPATITSSNISDDILNSDRLDEEPARDVSLSKKSNAVKHMSLNSIKENSAFADDYAHRHLLNMSSLDTRDETDNIDNDLNNTEILTLPGLEKQKENDIKVYFNIYGGPSLPYETITGGNSEYDQYRMNSESPHGSWNAGVEIKIEKQNWVITTGISYAEYNQHHNYTSSYEEYSADDSYYSYDTTWGWIFDPPDIATPIIIGIDSTWVDVYRMVTVQNSGINRTRYLEIPVMIGYRINKNLFSFEVNAGANIGFLTYSNFKVPDIDNHQLMIDDSDINHTMVNFSVNSTVYYYLNRKTSLFISPYYKRNLKPVFTNGSFTNQYNNIFGINFGISYTLR